MVCLKKIPMRGGPKSETSNFFSLHLSSKPPYIKLPPLPAVSLYEWIDSSTFRFLYSKSRKQYGSLYIFMWLLFLNLH